MRFSNILNEYVGVFAKINIRKSTVILLVTSTFQLKRVSVKNKFLFYNVPYLFVNISIHILKHKKSKKLQ